jgi:8-oxo-dGTP pyrophosphatase MutT (NUDIX family)
MPPIIKEVVIGTVIHGHEEVLLGKKDPRRSLAQYGSPLRYVFYGGKVHVGKGELPEDAFVREFKEESCLVTDKDSIEKVALILMEKHLPNGAVNFLRMHVFLTRKTTGVLRGTDEMEGWRWCNQRALPTYAMLAADPYWMPMIFEGRKIVVHAVTDRTQQRLLSPIHIQEVEYFPDERSKSGECPSRI